MCFVWVWPYENAPDEFNYQHVCIRVVEQVGTLNQNLFLKYQNIYTTFITCILFGICINSLEQTKQLQMKINNVLMYYRAFKY